MDVKKGNITVFLTLILLLILSLVLLTVESARINIVRSFVDRALFSSMDSVLADYHGYLLDDYSIFGLDTTYGSGDTGGKGMDFKLESYFNHVFTPRETLNGLNKGFDILDISVQSLAIGNETMLTDYEGKIFRDQAIEYMKYKKVGDGVNGILNSIPLIGEAQKTSEVYEIKLEVGNELAEIDKGILKLMKSLDGVKTTEYGMDFDVNGNIKLENNFIKKITTGEATMGSVGVNSSEIFNRLKGQYVDLADDFSLIESHFDSIKGIEKKIEELNKEIESIKEKDSWGDGKEGSTKDIKKIEKEIKKLNKEAEGFKKQINQAIKTISNLASKIKTLIPNTITIIEDLEKRSNEAEPLLSRYESALHGVKGELGERFINLDEELQDMKRYCSSDIKGGYNFAKLKEVLENNEKILEDTGSLLQLAKNEILNNNYDRALDWCRTTRDRFENYNIKDLAINYSKIKVVDSGEKNKIGNPITAIKGIIGSGLLSLIMDSSEISKLQINQENLPSKAHDSMVESSFDIVSLMKGLSLSGSGNLSSLFSNFREGDSITWKNNIVEHSIKEILFIEYINEYFQDYIEATEKVDKSPVVLKYEQEYILFGQEGDKDNLISSVSKINAMRTVLNFISIMGDLGKVNQAKDLATALVGFTGMPILIGLVLSVILILWAFAEALVDTCALVEGEKVAVIKSGKEFTIELLDIFTISRSKIQAKVKGLKGGLVELYYDQYLYLFLLTGNRKKISYYAMDLIQENIRLRYDKNFRMENCLFGFTSEAKIYINPKFFKMGTDGSSGLGSLHNYESGMVYSY